MIFAADALKKEGYTVDTLGLFEGDGGRTENADIIVLPVPVTRDTVNINCSMTGRTIPLDKLYSLPEKAAVYGGGKLKIKNYTDYLSLDEYAIKNAAVTAEGAICHAIENTAYSLWKSRILVIGYGKTGRALSERLAGFHPFLTVSARSGRDFAELSALGIKSIKTADIGKHKNEFDIVFNTVDIKFHAEVAAALSNALFIDISSRGGFRVGIAEKYGVKYQRLPALPAACAPESAGKIIADTVINLQKINGEKYE